MNDDFGQCGGIGCEALAQPCQVGQTAGTEIGEKDGGEVRLAAAIMGKAEKIDH